MLAKDGKAPEREFFCTERVCRSESWVISEGRVPETDLESRLMEVTVPVDLSQFTLVQEQKDVELDQPGGAGESAARSFDMTAASSENATEMKLTKKKRWSGAAEEEAMANGRI